MSICALIAPLLSFEVAADEQPAPRQAHDIHRIAYHQHIAKNYDEALKIYKQSAATGLAKSEYAVGRILAFDREGEHDYEAALPWILRAAQPRSESQGYGFIQTQRQAETSLAWYCKNGAAEFPPNHSLAQDPECWHGRAKALMFGWFDIEKDKDAARNLLEKSIAAGWTDAQKTLDKLNRPSEASTAKPQKRLVEGQRVFFVFFMILLAALILRSTRFRQFVYGLLYKFSA